MNKRLGFLYGILLCILCGLLLLRIMLRKEIGDPTVSSGIASGNASLSTQVSSIPKETGVTSATVPASLPTQATETSVPPETQVIEPQDSTFVRILDFIPGIQLDIRYATENNFTGKVIYASSEAWLRYGTVKKLMAVQQELAEQGLYLKVWDAFRPTAAQFKLWDVFPDPTYVSDPNKGFSSHSRGNTVDITLVDAQGKEVKMPTGFDDFSTLADRDYSDCDAVAAANARLLEQVMEKHGFKPYYGEWWHFSDTVQYDVEIEFLSQ